MVIMEIPVFLESAQINGRNEDFEMCGGGGQYCSNEHYFSWHEKGGERFRAHPPFDDFT